MAMENAGVLILSSSIGSGHNRASAALTRGVELLDDRKKVLTVDFPREVSPRMEQLLRTVYLECLKLWPRAYAELYRGSGSSHSERYQYYLDEPGLRTLDRLVSETGAEALVAPHFYGGGVLGYYKKRNPGVFTALVLTDYVPHPLGVPANLDLYIVADEAAASDVEELGVPGNRIHPTGIPIDPAFEEAADAEGARRDLLGLDPEVEEDDLPVVTVMGGGLGGGDLEHSVALLLEASAAMHLAVLCGSNDKSRQQLARLARQGGYSATFLGFTDRVRDLMAASAALVTKPGGMSCTEALAAGLPQVLYHPIPGNEEENAAAMVRYGAGVMVDHTDAVLGETLKILTSPHHHQRLVESALKAHRPQSARAAAELVLEGVA